MLSLLRLSAELLTWSPAPGPSSGIGTTRARPGQSRADWPGAGWSHLPHWPASWWSPQHGDHYQTIKTSTQTCNDPDRAVLVLHVLHVPRQSTSQRSTDIFPVIFNLFLIIMLQTIKSSECALQLDAKRCDSDTKQKTLCFTVLIRQLGDHWPHNNRALLNPVTIVWILHQ